jgi:hypothetical protein
MDGWSSRIPVQSASRNSVTGPVGTGCNLEFAKTPMGKVFLLSRPAGMTRLGANSFFLCPDKESVWPVNPFVLPGTGPLLVGGWLGGGVKASRSATKSPSASPRAISPTQALRLRAQPPGRVTQRVGYHGYRNRVAVIPSCQWVVNPAFACMPCWHVARRHPLAASSSTVSWYRWPGTDSESSDGWGACSTEVLATSRPHSIHLLAGRAASKRDRGNEVTVSNR